MKTKSAFALLFIAISFKALAQDDLYGPKAKGQKKTDNTAEIFKIADYENDSTVNWVYCQIVGTQKFLNPNKVTVEVDYGQKRKWFSMQDSRIRDEEGEIKDFNSMVDALNYLGSRGWEFVQAYAVTLGNSNVYHFLMRANPKNPLFIPNTKK